MRFLLLPLLISLLLAGCGQTRSKGLTPAATTPPTPSETISIPTQAPTFTPPATGVVSTATTTVTPSALIQLGEPNWLGRGKIMGAVFLRDAQEVAIAWGSGVSLHSVENGQEVWFQSTSANMIAFDVQSQEGNFAAALSDGSVIVFDAADGASRRFEGAKPNAYWGDIAWSPDGKMIAFQFIGANRNDPVYLLDVASGKISEIPDSSTGEGVGPRLVWSPDGTAISIAALGGNCPRFIDVVSGEERMVLGTPGQCYPITGLLFLACGKLAASSWQTGGVDILQYPDKNQIMTFEPAANTLAGGLTLFPAITSALFTDTNERWVASRGGYEPCYCGNPEDQQYHPLVVWDRASGKIRAQLEQAIDPLTELHRLAAAFDGEEIVMLYENGTITRWAFGNPDRDEFVSTHVPVHPVSAWSLRWSADGSHLAFTGLYGGVDVFATASGQLVRRFDPPLVSPALNPDGSLVALFDPGRNVEAIYELQSGRELYSLPATPSVMGAAFSPDGLYIAFGDGMRAVVAEAISAEMTFLNPASTLPLTLGMTVSRLVWSPDGQALATLFGIEGGDSLGPGSIVVWQRLEDGSFEAVYHVPDVQTNYPEPNHVLAVFNPSGNRVALQWMDAFEAGHTRLVVYDLETRKVLQNLREYKPALWVNDEVVLAAEAQYDTRLVRINTLTGQKEIGYGRDIGDSAYAPGGVFFAQMAIPPQRGIAIKLWKSNTAIAFAKHESLNLLDYSWSPDGRWLASVGDDGTLIIWPVFIPYTGTIDSGAATPYSIQSLDAAQRATAAAVLTQVANRKATATARIIQATASAPTPDWSAFTPTIDTTATAIVANLVSTVQPRRTIFTSPDRQWEIQLLTYQCTKVVPDEWYESAYDLLKIVHLSDGVTHIVADQLQYCGGVGAAGLGGITWSPGSRFFYFTPAREGVPDGTGSLGWHRPIFRFDTLTLQVETMGSGLISPDGQNIASILPLQNETDHNCGPKELVVQTLDGDILFRYTIEIDLQVCNLSWFSYIAWSASGDEIVYLDTPCQQPVDCRSNLYRVNLVSAEQTPLVQGHKPSFEEVAWFEPDRLKLTDMNLDLWYYTLSTGQLVKQDE